MGFVVRIEGMMLEGVISLLSSTSQREKEREKEGDVVRKLVGIILCGATLRLPLLGS